MKFKVNDITRAKLLILLSNDTKFNTISTKLLLSNEIELTDEEVNELVLLGLKLND